MAFSNFQIPVLVNRKRVIATAENKALLSEYGLFVFKGPDGDWHVRWVDPAQKRQKNEQKIEMWLSKLSACGCVQYFDDMLITKRTLKNGSVRYDWRCPVCRRTRAQRRADQ